MKASGDQSETKSETSCANALENSSMRADLGWIPHTSNDDLLLLLHFGDVCLSRVLCVFWVAWRLTKQCSHVGDKGWIHLLVPADIHFLPKNTRLILYMCYTTQ